jgi:hypothetical protein
MAKQQCPSSSAVARHFATTPNKSMLGVDVQNSVPLRDA